MKMNRKWLGLGGVFALTVSFAITAFAMDSGHFRDPSQGLYDELVKSCMQTVKKDCVEWALKGGGSEAPRGLRPDTKVELANGEVYRLAGIIEIQGQNVYLNLDFRKTPWLDSRARRRNPYYRISDSIYNWKARRGESVSILVTAKYSVYTEKGRTKFEIVLVPTP